MPVATPDQYAEMLDRGEGGRIRVSRLQRVLLADSQLCSAGPVRSRLRRHPADLDRRRRLLRRPVGQGARVRRSRVRRVRHGGCEELSDQGCPAHRPLPGERVGRIRHAPHRGIRGRGEGRPQPHLPVPHVGRVRRAAGRERAHRRRAASPDEGDPLDPRGGDRRGRRRRRRRQQRGRRAPLHDPGRRGGDGGGAGLGRERPLHHRPHLRQRARCVQAGEREAAPRTARRDPEGPGRPSTAPATSRSIWCSTAAQAHRMPRSPKLSPTA